MLKSFENRDGWIWMNGKIIPWQDANSHIISQGLHYASAVFEGERAYNGKIFKSEEHTKRFFKSAVDRNRIKRQLRSIVRKSSAIANIKKGVSFFIIYNTPKALGFNEIEEKVGFLIKKLVNN